MRPPPEVNTTSGDPGRTGGHATTAAAKRGEPRYITTPLLTLMAVACGVIVADIYYSQPLLPELARDLRISDATAGLAVTATQLGFATGLLFLVPLGDLVARRRLTVLLLTISAFALAAVSLAPGPTVLLAALAVVGLTSCAVNVLVPFAAALAPPERRGRVVGTVMTGLLLGVLLSRTVSGQLAELAGWRTVYRVAAVAIVLLAVVLHRKLPDLPPADQSRYPELLRSIGGLLRTTPLLRRRIAYGALGFASFSLLWTAIPFLLAGPPYHYSTSVIGLFGLVGAAGVLCTQVAGRLLDRGWVRQGTLLFVALITGSWAVLAAEAHLVPLLIGIVLLDLGVQGLHVLNQARIYSIGARVHSRVTTAYMVGYFAGGTFGSGLAIVVYQHGGWGGVCLSGVVLGAVSIVLWLTDRNDKE